MHRETKFDQQDQQVDEFSDIYPSPTPGSSKTDDSGVYWRVWHVHAVPLTGSFSRSGRLCRNFRSWRQSGGSAYQSGIIAAWWLSGAWPLQQTPFDPWGWLHQLIEERKQTHPGPYRERRPPCRPTK